MTLSKDTIDSMADGIAVLAAQIDVATHQLLGRIREFDDAGGWFRQGALSCAHWLSWRVGMGLGAAREKVRVAHRLAELPLIDAAFGSGEISYSKVRAMTRVATADNEEMLLLMARKMTAAQLEKTCRLYRGVKRLEGSAEVLESTDRFVRSRDTEDQMVSIQIKLLPEEAARFLKAAEVSAQAGSLADGVVHMAEVALLGGDSEKKTRPPVEAIVHIDAENLAGHTDQGDGISAETSRRILCDCGVVPMVEDGQGKTLDVGRKTRTIPSAIRRALAARDDGCAFPGCTNTRFVDAHHVEHWIDGGKTELSNLVSLCRRHHRFVHEWGFSIEKREGQWVFLRPDGRVTWAVPKRPITTWTPQPITPSVNECGWDGVPIQYDLCVAALF